MSGGSGAVAPGLGQDKDPKPDDSASPNGFADGYRLTRIAKACPVLDTEALRFALQSAG